MVVVLDCSENTLIKLDAGFIYWLVCTADQVVEEYVEFQHFLQVFVS